MPVLSLLGQVTARRPILAVALLVASSASASPPLSDRVPSSTVAFVGASRAALADPALDADRLASLPMGRVLAEAVRCLESAGVAVRRDADAMACAVLGPAVEAPLAVCASGPLDRAAIEAHCLAEGATREAVGAVSALRLPGAGSSPLYLSFLATGEAVVAPAEATIELHAAPAAPSALQRLAAAVPTDALAWMAAERAWLDAQAAGQLHPLALDIERIAAWSHGAPTMQLRLVAEAPSTASAAAVVSLWQGLVDLAAPLASGNVGLEALARANLRSNGTLVIMEASLTRAEVEAIP